MNILNITFGVGDDATSIFIDFIKEIIIPALENEGASAIILTKVNGSEFITDNDNISKSFALQMQLVDIDDCHRILHQVIPELFGHMDSQLAQSVHSYATILEVIYISDNNGKYYPAI